MIAPFQPTPQCLPIVERGRRVGTLCVGGPTLKMPVRGKTVHFEMHNYCGPIPINARTECALKVVPTGFWDAFERWERGGKLVDGDVCVVPEWCAACRGHGDEVKPLDGRNSIVVGCCKVCGGNKIATE